jgi:hypothetical protein
MTWMKEKTNPGYNGKYVLATVYMQLGEGCARIIGEHLGYTPSRLNRQFNEWRKSKWFNEWRERASRLKD